jgi:plastocyanin
MHRLAKGLAATAVATALVAAPATSASAALAAKVRIVDNQFRPGTITVAAGSTVGWLNRGASSHTVTFEDGFDEVLSPGEKTRRRFDAPGTYDYVCRFHFGMAGEVVVTS